MMRLLARLTKRRLLVVLMVASTVSALMGSGFATRLRNAAQWALAPIGDLGMYLTATFESNLSTVSGQNAGGKLSPDEIKQLLEEREDLLYQLRAVERQRNYWWRQVRAVQNIRGRYRPIADFPCELIPARVVFADTTPYRATRVLNVGRSNGVNDGAAVTERKLLTDRAKAIPEGLTAITVEALVGRIVATGRLTAKLQLVTDRAFRIDAAILRDPNNPRQIVVTEGSAAMEPLTPANNSLILVKAQGSGTDKVIAREVKAYENVLPGDWLVTRGNDETLPIEIRIGKVTKVVKDPKYPRRVTVYAKPLADLQALYKVYIVVPVGSRNAEISPETSR